MSAPEWTDNLQAAHDAVVAVRLDDEDVDTLDANGYGVSDYQNIVAEAFFQYKDDPNNQLSPNERYNLREIYFTLIEDMGYDREDWDWDVWRAWMGYQ